LFELIHLVDSPKEFFVFVINDYFYYFCVKVKDKVINLPLCVGFD